MLYKTRITLLQSLSDRCSAYQTSEFKKSSNLDIVKNKHSPGGVFIKRCSDNVQQIYRRTMRNFTTWVFCYNFDAYFQDTFWQECLWGTASAKNEQKKVFSTSLFISPTCKYWFFLKHTKSKLQTNENSKKTMQ